MPVCKVCQEEVDSFVAIKVAGKINKMCEECGDKEREKNEIAEASEGVVQEMMGFTGRR